MQIQKNSVEKKSPRAEYVFMIIDSEINAKIDEINKRAGHLWRFL